jgi:hypothetical protein
LLLPVRLGAAPVFAWQDTGRSLLDPDRDDGAPIVADEEFDASIPPINPDPRAPTGKDRPTKEMQRAATETTTSSTTNNGLRRCALKTRTYMRR